MPFGRCGVRLPFTHVRASWRPGEGGDAIPRKREERTRVMEIGKPLKKIVVEPIRDPVPERSPQPTRDPAPPSRPEPVRVP
jgi:hypothetical protein